MAALTALGNAAPQLKVISMPPSMSAAAAPRSSKLSYKWRSMPVFPPLSTACLPPRKSSKSATKKDSLTPETSDTELALRLAARGAGWVNPNPMVGAVVVKDGQVVGRGYHRRAGAAPCRSGGLGSAGEAARGADLYVTLEPCNHQGRTPPCTQAILRPGCAGLSSPLRTPIPRSPAAEPSSWPPGEWKWTRGSWRPRPGF